MKTLAEVREELNQELPADSKDRNNKIRINGAKAYMRQVLGDFEGDLKEAITALAGASSRGGFGGRVSPKKAIVAKLVEMEEMSDMDCFKEFNKGPAEMREIQKYAIKELAPADRVWIEFKDGVYSVVAEGADAPEDWDGYVYTPTDINEDL